MKSRATLAVVLAFEQGGCKEARETLKAVGAQLPSHRSADDEAVQSEARSGSPWQQPVMQG